MANNTSSRFGCRMGNSTLSLSILKVTHACVLRMPDKSDRTKATRN